MKSFPMARVLNHIFFRCHSIILKILLTLSHSHSPPHFSAKNNARIFITMTRMVLHQQQHQQSWCKTILKHRQFNLFKFIYCWIFFCPSFIPQRWDKEEKKSIHRRKRSKYEPVVYLHFVHVRPDKSNLWLCSMKIEQTKWQQQRQQKIPSA